MEIIQLVWLLRYIFHWIEWDLNLREFQQILQQAYPLPLKDDTEKDSFHLGYWRDLGYASKVCMFKSSENLIWLHGICMEIDLIGFNGKMMGNGDIINHEDIVWDVILWRDMTNSNIFRCVWKWWMLSIDGHVTKWWYTTGKICWTINSLELWLENKHALEIFQSTTMKVIKDKTYCKTYS